MGRPLAILKLLNMCLNGIASYVCAQWKGVFLIVLSNKDYNGILLSNKD